MAVRTSLSLEPARAAIRCTPARHRFKEMPVPPGSPCECGDKVMIYDPCRKCGIAVPRLGDVKALEEGYYPDPRGE